MVRILRYRKGNRPIELSMCLNLKHVPESIWRRQIFLCRHHTVGTGHLYALVALARENKSAGLLVLEASLAPEPLSKRYGREHNTTHSHSLNHGAEPFLRSCQLCIYSRTSQRFRETEGSLPPSQEPSTGPYPEPDRSNPSHPIISL
jgi:hypothetical protein